MKIKFKNMISINVLNFQLSIIWTRRNLNQIERLGNKEGWDQ